MVVRVVVWDSCLPWTSEVQERKEKEQCGKIEVEDYYYVQVKLSLYNSKPRTKVKNLTKNVYEILKNKSKQKKQNHANVESDFRWFR